MGGWRKNSCESGWEEGGMADERTDAYNWQAFQYVDYQVGEMHTHFR